LDALSDIHFGIGRSQHYLALPAGIETRDELPEGVPDACCSNLANLQKTLSRRSFLAAYMIGPLMMSSLPIFAQGKFISVATDGCRLVLAESNVESGGNTEFLVPKAAMTHTIKLADASEGGAKVEIATDENHLFFGFGVRQLVCRKLSGNLPDWKRVLPNFKSGDMLLVNRVELIAALERAVQFADDRSHATRFAFSSGELVIEAQSVDTGDAHETIPSTGDKSMEIGFNADYPLDFLREATAEQVEIWLIDSNHAAEFRPHQGIEYREIVMPMRL
jgi:DNA polymerase-3 subunit beta